MRANWMSQNLVIKYNCDMILVFNYHVLNIVTEAPWYGNYPEGRFKEAIGRWKIKNKTK